MSEAKVVDKPVDDRIFVSSAGTHYKQDILYKWSDKDNCMVPYLGEVYDLYEKIQLAKTTCDLDVIMKRAKAGDTSVLHVKNEYYGDVSDMPDNLNDMKALNDKISSDFSQLPSNIKALFGNDLDAFSKAVADGSFNDTINNYILSLNKNKEEKKVDGDK